jgi:quercetin dioxygenase-like cupin family protein
MIRFGLGRRARARKALFVYRAASREELMKRTLFALIVGAAIVNASAGMAEVKEAHKVFLPQDIKWGSTPPSLPAGAEAAVLYGDPAKEGMFVLRVRMPKGYKIAPHTHPQPEVITVISGKLNLGMGSKVDRASVESLPAGSFSSMPTGLAHYAFVDEDTVVQINSTGPWSIDYLDPKDDPRLNVAPAK